MVHPSEPGDPPDPRFATPLTSPSWPSARLAGGQASPKLRYHCRPSRWDIKGRRCGQPLDSWKGPSPASAQALQLCQSIRMEHMQVQEHQGKAQTHLGFGQPLSNR